MKKSIRAYKTEIYPTESQKAKIHKTIGVCRFIYNFYISENEKSYREEKGFISGYDFSKWMNNEYVPNNPDMAWIKEVSSKAVKESIMNCEKAYRRFFSGESRYPRFKKKKKQNVKAYFPKNNKGDLSVERHRIKIPTLGWTRLKEKAFIPVGATVKSCTVSQKADRYFISVLIEEQAPRKFEEFDSGIGIDLGLSEFAVMSNGNRKKNINKTGKTKKLEKKLKREQRKLSRKFEALKIRKKKGGESVTRNNIIKQTIVVQKLHMRLANIRTNYINQIVNDILKRKPSFVAIEDLNIRGMMKNRHLAKAVASQKFYEFRTKLTYKAIGSGIEVRIVDRWYPSSKSCSKCGFVKKDLKLKDRTFICECGAEINRDLNAAYNLAKTDKYKIAKLK